MGYVVDKMTLQEVFLQVLCFVLSLPFDHCSILIHVSVTNASNLSNLQHHILTHLREKNVLDSSYSYLLSRHMYVTLWHLMSVIPVTQHDTQNVEHQVQMTAFSGLPLAGLI